MKDKNKPKCNSDYYKHNYESFDDNGFCKFGCGMTWNMYDDFYADFIRTHPLEDELRYITNG